MTKFEEIIQGWEMKEISTEEASRMVEEIALDLIREANNKSRNDSELFATINLWSRMCENIAACMDLYSLYIQDEINKDPNKLQAH